MADGRMLKKQISRSRRLAELKTDSARMLYTWIIPHLDVKGRMEADPTIIKGEVVPRLTTFTPDKIQQYLDDMANVGLIILYKYDNDQYLELRKFEDHQSLRENREAPSRIPTPDYSTATPEQLQEDSGSLPLEDKLREEKRIYSQVIDYLNTKSGKDFKVRSRGNQRHIDARVNEGFCFEDFQLVIDHKVAQWKDDTKMSEYIRPETLFGPKFESYLQEAKNGGGLKPGVWK